MEARTVWHVKCPHDDCDGELEARATVMLDVYAATYDADTEVVRIEDMGFSRLNDELDGMPVDLEMDFRLACTEGHRFDDTFSDALKARIGLQPVGDAPRTLGTRGGA